MAILEGIQIENFRALRNVVLGKSAAEGGTPLPRMMAVIGANGSGKSTLLDALGFIGDCLAPKIKNADSVTIAKLVIIVQQHCLLIAFFISH